MHNPPDDPLTDAERDAFAKMSREREPSEQLEQRVVLELRSRGILRPAHTGVVRVHRIGFAWPSLQVAAGFAVCVALFASGIAVGQWLGLRHTTEAMLQMHQQDAAQAAALVERTGNAYVTALGTLAQVSGNSTPQEAARAREAAQSVMHAAANEMVRLAPDDPLAVQILQGMDRAREKQAQANGQAANKRRLAWF
jgi:hypothetical protein